MKHIAIQAGHVNAGIGMSKGAPNEAAFNWDIVSTVAGELRLRGFDVKQTDANAHKDPEILGTDWDLFLAVHYDADIYNTGGGFVDFPEPSTDGATAESQRIAYLIRQEYFGTTGIVSHPERSNANTRYYYMWQYLSAKTPCNLIECGVGMHVPDDWQILHFNRPLVVQGLVKGICLAFNVPYDLPTTTTTETTTSTSSSTTTTTTTLPMEDCCSLVEKSKEILYNKGFWWTKINKLKALLPSK